MKRRLFLLAPTIGMLAACGGGGEDSAEPGSASSSADPGALDQKAPPTAAATAASRPIDAVATIKALRIPSGPYAGAYEIAPNGKLNWYFAALGLLPIVRNLGPADLQLHIRSYLDVYLRSINANLSIDDVDFPVGRADTTSCSRVLSDSDDSYAATFLSLAAKYVEVSGDRTWWQANKAQLKHIAYRNLAMPLKSHGLTSVFQAPRNSSNSIGYLMDNCEVYRGLRDFATALRASGDGTDAKYYDALASSIGVGIKRLFVPGSNAFLPGDAYRAPEASFYAGTTCQVFPQAFGVTECAEHFDAAWKYLNTYTPGWEDGRYDTYPWAVLGYVAALRGQFAQARALAALVERLHSTNPERVTINELGFYHRTVSLLAGVADS